ncbi:glycosyl transferase family 2 [Spirochaeta thermophila DSM 6578]|uniref:Glycosyl transferase family 2 n=1 Tax=Winmispira thermophila (strain ATCC 700085 / DSM 6578 / Z-1203) TaxID=869211 RepID=G0GAY1_WINT7|nr:glycosyltransferase family 2 protein [Spirochaeta thermophila]AEJ61877.1 glycosyl transferase family 2 [Spirochaeta thermophila DSM 6578]
MKSQQVLSLGRLSTTRYLIRRIPQIDIPSTEEAFSTLLSLPPHPSRKREDGLRKNGLYKYSFRQEDGKWWAVEKGVLLFQVEGRILSPFEGMLPLVTVITVTYNAEKHLRDAMESVLSQTYPNVEYIVIDGGSSDGTLRILEEYSCSLDYWLSEPDEGVYHAFNKGLLLARGEIVGFLNADDEYLPRAVEESVGAILSSGVDYSIGAVIHIDQKILMKPIFPLSSNKIYQEMPYPHIGAFFRRSVYKKTGLFDTRYRIAADHDMALRIIKRGFIPVYVERVIGKVRGGGISDSIGANEEFMRIAVAHGKPRWKAYLSFAFQLVKVGIQRILPDFLVKCIKKKMKKSRFEMLLP